MIHRSICEGPPTADQINRKFVNFWEMCTVFGLITLFSPKTSKNLLNDQKSRAHHTHCRYTQSRARLSPRVAHLDNRGSMDDMHSRCCSPMLQATFAMSIHVDKLAILTAFCPTYRACNHQFVQCFSSPCINFSRLSSIADPPTHRQIFCPKLLTPALLAKLLPYKCSLFPAILSHMNSLSITPLRT